MIEALVDPISYCTIIEKRSENLVQGVDQVVQAPDVQECLVLTRK
jgi:hypothetical protein